MGQEPAGRPEPRQAKLLLPIWGHAYVRDFLRYSLPSLLAPGNVPALADRLPTEFVFLTTVEDEPELRSADGIHKLEDVCAVSIHRIDHLVSDANYSTSITLAYAEAVADVGPAMTDTCFFLLTSDYVLSDGSLLSVLGRMLDGVSAIQVGNFQVQREQSLPWLENRLRRLPDLGPLRSRELMTWALAHLHPATVANMVNVPFNRNSHTNRLFWRVDDSALVGRFYLKHPICVRPEEPTFLVGSSVDYSFVPEMCPYGRVESIVDSDDYLAIELQPLGHENGFLRFGPLTPRQLARSLAEWTTARHRANVRDHHIFHSGEPPPALESVVLQSDQFVDQVAGILKRRRPQPYRGHRYWKGAIGAFYETCVRDAPEMALPFVYGMPIGLWGRLRWWRRSRFILLGRPPRTYPWDPMWPDYQTVLDELGDPEPARPASLLIVSNQPTAYSRHLAHSRANTHSVRTATLLKEGSTLPEIPEAVDLCLVEVPDEDLRDLVLLLDRLKGMLRPGGRVVLLPALNHRGVVFLGEIDRTGMTMDRAIFVPMPRPRALASLMIIGLYRLVVSQPLVGLPVGLLLGGPAVLLATVCNVASRSAARRARPIRACSSFVVVLSPHPI